MNPSTPRQPGDTWSCSCGEALLAAASGRGRTMPLTGAKAEGNIVLTRSTGGELIGFVLTGQTLERARELGVALRLNHFADCPHKNRYGPRK